MKVVALVSGGKDSCYAMMKCQSYGHEIVALAHISPPSGCAEPDSMMYQSVGSDALPAIADALGLPLYTRSTTATATVTSLAYTPNPTAVNRCHDEVEDLLELLMDVKRAHPDVKAACCGALWSDYQRLRVESVTARAGLLSLAYLWRREQAELLDEIIDAGIHAVLVKVAGIGLNERHLGKSLVEMRPILRKLEAEYGSHICGEGGEYETLVLSAPMFRYDLEILDEDIEVVRHLDSPYNPVAFLKIQKLVRRAPTTDHRSRSTSGSLLSHPVVPAALCPLREDIFVNTSDGELSGAKSNTLKHNCANQNICASSHRVGDYIYAVAQSCKCGGNGLTSAVRALRDILRDQCLNLSSSSADPLEHVLYIILRPSSLDGDNYKQVNEAYSAEFGTAACTPPPSRACIAMEGTGHAISIEALARVGRRSDSETVTLHVQSLSEWAPPCIGPYSQTVVDSGIIYVCGVLPLHSPSASIPKSLGAQAQTRACMHNMSRTLEATPCGLSDLGWFVAYVVDHSIAVVVEQEIRNFLGQSEGSLLIVPVQALPKSALVEIRAVGCVGGPVIAKQGLFPTVQMKHVTYVAHEMHDWNTKYIAEAAKVMLDNGPILSLHVFYVEQDPDCTAARSTKQDALQLSLQSAGIVCSLVVMEVGWLAHDASTLLVATHVRHV